MPFVRPLGINGKEGFANGPLRFKSPKDSLGRLEINMAVTILTAINVPKASNLCSYHENFFLLVQATMPEAFDKYNPGATSQLWKNVQK